MHACVAKVPEDSQNNVDKPTRQDIVVDESDTQQTLCWYLYLQRLASGAWADHGAIQGAANMLSIAIHILSSVNGLWTLVSPTNDTDACHDVYVGLLGQLHYVGLDAFNHDVHGANQ